MVPVGECSGPIPVGATPISGSSTTGTVEITELPTPNVWPNDVTAAGYNATLSAYEPNQLAEPYNPQTETATVIVNAPAVDTAQETIVTFTNFEAPPAELKVCKVAGNSSVPVGTPFPFTVNGGAAFTVEAGPLTEGGYCVVVPGTFQVGTSVTVAEMVPVLYAAPTVTVNGTSENPSCPLPGPVEVPFVPCSVATVIGPGINEVSFTNSTNITQPASGEDPFSGLSIVNYSLVSQVPATGTQSYMTYRADLMNTGTTAMGPIVATLTSLDPSSAQVVGQGALTFASAPPNRQVASRNTFTILTKPAVPLDFSKLSWTYQSRRSIRPAHLRTKADTPSR